MSISKPYIKPLLSRFAIFIGSVFKSDIRYKGIKMEDAFAGLKPMIGISFNLTKLIAIHGGLLLFRQPSINPLALVDAEKRSSLKISSYIGVTFDVDILNKIKIFIESIK